MSAAGTTFAQQAAAVGAVLGGIDPSIGGPAAPSAGPVGLPSPLGMRELPLTTLILSHLNPRPDPGDLRELQTSLGTEQAPWLVQFPAVMDRSDGTYELIFGYRRYRAALTAGWQQMLCIVWPALTPVQVQRMRLLENVHHQPLDTLAAAAALQVLYYTENAVACGCGPAVAALLEEPSASLAAKVPPLHDLLLQTGWQATHPPVTWQVVLDRHGIELSPGSRKRLLAVLNVDPDLRPVVQEQGLSPSSIRALGRLPPEAQHQVLTAVQETPPLAGKIKRIARVVQRKGYTVAEALDEARGPWGEMDAPDDAAGGSPEASDAGAVRGEEAGTALPMVSAQIQSDVTEILSMGNRLASLLARIHHETGGGAITTLPAPWGAYARTGLTLIRQALGPDDPG